MEGRMLKELVSGVCNNNSNYNYSNINNSSSSNSSSSRSHIKKLLASGAYDMIPKINLDILKLNKDNTVCQGNKKFNSRK